MDDVLQYAVDHGMIDVSSIRKTIELDKRKEILKRYLASDKGKIWQAKNGRWYAYLYVEGKRKTPSRQTKAEIENYVIDALKEQDENPTIKEVFDEWNERRLELQKISRSTFDKNVLTFKRHYSGIEHRKLHYMQPEEIEDFLERQIPKFNLTAKGFSNLKCITKGFLTRAKKRGIISWNVAYMLSELDVSEADFKKTVEEDEKQVFDEEETEKIVRYMRENFDTLNAGLLLLFASGLRVGELATLKPEDIDIDYVNVRRTETHYLENGKNIYSVKDFPKSRAGWRTVVISSEWEWLMRKLKLLNPWGQYLFESKGQRITIRGFSSRLRRVCKRCGIVPKSPHKIRKTYGTILLDANIDNNLIMQQMGHTDILTTEKHYHRNRKTIEAKKKILNAVNFV